MCVILTPAYAADDSISANVSVTESGTLATVTIYGQLIVDGMPKEGAVIGIVVSKDGTKNVFADEATTNTTGHFRVKFRIDNTEGATYVAYATPASTYAENIIAVREFSVGCIELWDCTSWTSCNSNYTQSRTCTDRNSCGTIYYKPATSRKCTCEILDGEICSKSETCYGGYMDASDSERCCSGYCYTKSSTGTSSSSSSGSTSKTTATTDTNDDDEDDDDGDEKDTTSGKQTSDTVDGNQTDDNNTLNETGSTNSTSSGIMPYSEDDKNTPTGRLEAFFIESRGMLINILLLIVAALMGWKIMANKERKDREPANPVTGGKYSFRPKGGAGRNQFKAIINKPKPSQDTKAPALAGANEPKEKADKNTTDNTTTKLRVRLS